MILKFFLSDSFSFDSGKMDLRTNPFQEGGNNAPWIVDPSQDGAQLDPTEVSPSDDATMVDRS